MNSFEKKHPDTKHSKGMDEVTQVGELSEPEKVNEDVTMISPEAGIEDNPNDIQEEEVTLPPPPEESVPFLGIIQDITYWGFSQRGESHIKNGLPCQDRCKVFVSNNRHPVLISAIADGVGSCALSHYGAAIATESSTTFLKEKLDNYPDEKLEDKVAGDLLRGAMQCACDTVQKSAEEMEQLEYSFQSTLTIALYDGDTLYISHAGDDGVVVITEEGKLELVTSRIKGEEASSVYPLQAGMQYWQVFKVDRVVNGFVMATDGVLDAFVKGEQEGNRIYYPFIQPAFETKQKSEKDIKEIIDFYYDYMSGGKYRQSVTDDLTMVVVTNQRKLTKKNFPAFDESEWKAKTEEYRARVNAALYPNDAEPDPKCTEKKEIQIPQFEKREKYPDDSSHNYCPGKQSEELKQKSTKSVQKSKKKEYLDFEAIDKKNKYDWGTKTVLIIIAVLLIVLGVRLAIGILFGFLFW